jgi:hypothetical protein
MLELNEVNFDQVRAYADQGKLPAFKAFIDKHGLYETTSEQLYDELEPWIQWVTAHTGLTLAEHGVFRLGDIVNTDIPQIWERLEALGYRVGAISPMNAKCRAADPAFFIPDPWTRTKVVGSPRVRRLYDAIAEMVNENASSRPSLRALCDFAIGGLLYSRPQAWPRYLMLAAKAKSRPWLRALFLDLLLADVFIKSVRSTQPQFATIFLNAAAHIQHHYMYSSRVYTGEIKNPSWYVREGEDPVLDVYKLYDAILHEVQAAFPDARLMLATGLHQDPHGALTFYWRLRAHEAFLKGLGIAFERVEPRMSRDFLVVCANPEAAQAAEQVLRGVLSSDGKPLFEVDNRGCDLFVMLVRDQDIPEDLTYLSGGKDMGLLKPHVAFVAIKNGQHNGIGYFADSHTEAGQYRESFPLSQIPDRILAAFGHPNLRMAELG